MASLKDIRRRIGSVKNTQQITKAMKLVAASKLRRAQQAITSAKPFAEKLEEMTERILKDISEELGRLGDEKKQKALSSLHPLLQQNSPKEGEQPAPMAFVVVASDRGLCGAYNSNILKFALKEAKAVVDSGMPVKFFFIGKRASDAFTKRGFMGEFLSEVWTGKFTTAKADKVANLFTEKFLRGELSSVVVYYTQFKTVLSQIVSKQRLLPLDLENKKSTHIQGKKPEWDKKFIYEPGQKKLLASLLPGMVRTTTYKMLADSLASEYGARMTAMDNATRNAGQMISRLTLEANRVRQASITKELMEIVGGAEALKG